jgi:two-component system chemotaxis response regulator CheY
MRDMVRIALTGAGFDVAQAADGQQALQLARQSAFDLVLSDVNMPVMDGIAMVRELRAMDAYKGVPILMLTTESHTEKKMEGKAAGATGWLVKPFDPEQLLATVKRVLG